MNKRANRVYWLLAIMLFIFFMSIIIDCIRAGIRNSQVDSVNVEENVEVSSEMTSVEITTENTTKVESTETTSELSNTDVQKVKEFYSGQVFIGDSIMSGFANYASTANAPEWLNNVVFLSKVSWNISSALNGDEGIFYQGKTQSLIDAISQIKPNRIFINLGINEMNGLGSPGYSYEKLLNKYSELVTKIKEASPNSKIYVLSITPCTEKRETATFSNTIIKEFNKEVENSAKTWGVTYLDLAGEFSDVLSTDLSTDGVHHNNKSYTEKWVPFFERLALTDK